MRCLLHMRVRMERARHLMWHADAYGLMGLTSVQQCSKFASARVAHQGNVGRVHSA